MARVKFSWCKLKRIEINETNDTRYYNSYDKKAWEEIKAMLNKFGVKFPSKYEVEFSNEEYQIKTIPNPFGTTEADIVYKDVIIAKVSADGSNICDREGKLIIYMDKLKAIYND